MRARYLVFELMRVLHHCAAFKRLCHPEDLYLFIFIHQHFGASGDMASFFKAARDAIAMTGSLGTIPPERLCSDLENRFKPVVVQVFQPELQLVHLNQPREVGHVAFACKNIACRGKRPIRALS